MVDFISNISLFLSLELQLVCVCFAAMWGAVAVLRSACFNYLRDLRSLHTCCVNSLDSSSLKVIFLTRWPRLNTYAERVMFACARTSPVSPPGQQVWPWNRTTIWISFARLLRARRFSNRLILRPYFTSSDTPFFGRGLALTHYGGVPSPSPRLRNYVGSGQRLRLLCRMPALTVGRRLSR